MRNVLITGGTGTLGTALALRLLERPGTIDPIERVIIYSRDELKQALLAERLQDPRVRFMLGDVRDPERLALALRGVDTVVHAAALKRVDAIAYNPSEVKRTNIDGTHNVCIAALQAGVARVLLVSSDKAVLPTNIYGTSKQFAEHLTIFANSYSAAAQRTRFACVRYGNVLGSRGSVVQLWRDAAAAGQPIRLTDEAMTRFCMTIAEACRLVLWTLRHMEGGEIVVPLLPTMYLADLATAILLERGWPAEACAAYARTIIGWRPGGEKLHEAMMTADEAQRAGLAKAGGDAYCVIRPALHPWSLEPPSAQLPSLIDSQLIPGVGQHGYVSNHKNRILAASELVEMLRDVP